MNLYIISLKTYYETCCLYFKIMCIIHRNDSYTNQTKINKAFNIHKTNNIWEYSIQIIILITNN